MSRPKGAGAAAGPQEAGRRSARRAAVVVLYQREITGLPLEDLERNARRAGFPLEPFARSLVEGVSSSTQTLDRMIDAATEGWTPDRLAPLELSILRVAVHEMVSRQDIPTAVSINEAVELAKRYCQQQAPGLVNGILGRVARDIGATPAAPASSEV